MKQRPHQGFSFVELVVSMTIMLAITGSMFKLVHAARHAFELDLERAEMEQRMRVSMDALFRDLVMAGAGQQIPALAPFRRGALAPDPPGSAFSDRISIRYVPPGSVAGPPIMTTYALRPIAAGVLQFTRYDGEATDLPVVDQVVSLRFEYFDASGQQIPMDRFTDGPWIPDAVAADRFDADLQAIRRVRARLRVRPSRVLMGFPIADLDAAIDVSPRNLNPP